MVPPALQFAAVLNQKLEVIEVKFDCTERRFLSGKLLEGVIWHSTGNFSKVMCIILLLGHHFPIEISKSPFFCLYAPHY